MSGAGGLSIPLDLKEGRREAREGKACSMGLDVALDVWKPFLSTSSLLGLLEKLISCLSGSIHGSHKTQAHVLVAELPLSQSIRGPASLTGDPCGVEACGPWGGADSRS